MRDGKDTLSRSTDNENVTGRQVIENSPSELFLDKSAIETGVLLLGKGWGEEGQHTKSPSSK